MTTVWLRVALIVALIGSLFVGIWDFFMNPTPETAVAAVIPTVEKVERAREVTDPVVQFVSEQDAASVDAMVAQAKVEFDASLSHPGAPLEIIELTGYVPSGGVAPLTRPAPEGATSTQSASVEPGREPGIDWYRGE